MQEEEESSLFIDVLLSITKFTFIDMKIYLLVLSLLDKFDLNHQLSVKLFSNCLIISLIIG